MEDKKIYTQEEISQMSLEERMLMYRSQTDYRLPKNSYVLCMLDGRKFSSGIKKRFQQPFDDDFIEMMNSTAAYVCSQVQGAKFAYVQSDEISIYMTDINDGQDDNNETTLFFDGRLCKMQSIIAGLATAYFNRRIFEYVSRKKLPQWDTTTEYIKPQERIISELEHWPYYHFDAKVWTVPKIQEIVNWFNFRNTDCTRNSKQQAAQTYLPHKALLNKHTDEQIEMLLKICRIDWNDYEAGKKYGRFIYKEKELHTREFKGEQIEYERSVWKAHDGCDLTVAENRDWLYNQITKGNNIEVDPNIY